MIIMSVDYGDVRTGIAVCDKFEMLASPVCVITEREEEKLIEQISDLAKKYKAERLAVGLPKNMDSSIGERGEKCILFAEKLEKYTSIPTVTVDERLTTVIAHNALSSTNVRGKKRKDTVDKVAAVLILQSYLDSRKNGLNQ